MASLTGCAGGPSINIFEWSADLRRDIYDDSDFNSATNARSKMGGMADLVGTIRGRAKEGTTPDFGTTSGMDAEHATAAANFYLVTQGGTTDSNYKFSGLLSQMRISTPKVGQIEVTANFESSGAVLVNQTV
jgi:hypothetical protein